MNEPLRIAWLGHQSGRAGDGLLTYSREIVAGLRARGVKVFFVHHGALPAVTDDTLTLRSLTAAIDTSSPRPGRSAPSPTSCAASRSTWSMSPSASRP